MSSPMFGMCQAWFVWPRSSLALGCLLGGLPAGVSSCGQRQVAQAFSFFVFWDSMMLYCARTPEGVLQIAQLRCASTCLATELQLLSALFARSWRDVWCR